MDIIDQLFPQTEPDDSIADQFFMGLAAWQILSSVHNSSDDKRKEEEKEKVDGVEGFIVDWLSKSMETALQMTFMDLFNDWNKRH